MSSLCSSEDRSPLLRHHKDEGYPQGWRLFWIGISLGLLLVVSGIEVTIIATVAVRIAEEFKSTALAPYLSSTFLLASATTGPIYARVSDHFGRAPVVLFAGSLLTVGISLSATAPNALSLLLARTICGFGGGGLSMLCQIILSETVHPKRRAFWYSVGKMVSALSMAFGGPLGGILSDQASWRLAFAIQIPICILALCASFVSLNWTSVPLKSIEDNIQFSSGWFSAFRDIDFLGSVLLALVVTPLLLLFSVPSQGISLQNTLTAALLVMIVLICGPLLYRTERRAKHPIIDFALLENRTIRLLCALNFTTGFTHNAIMYAIPWITVMVDHGSSTRAGIRLLPISVAASLGSLFVGAKATKESRYHAFLTAGAICLCCGPLLLALDMIVPKAPLYHEILQVLGTLPSAWGYQVVGSISMVVILLECRHEEVAVSTSIATLCKSLGAMFGSAACTLISQIYLRISLVHRLHDSPRRSEIIDIITNSPTLIDALDRDVRDVAYDCWKNSFIVSLSTVAILSGISLLLVISIRSTGRRS